MAYRFLLTSFYVLLAVAFIVVNVMGVGHGPDTFDFVLYCAYPTAFVIGFLEPLVGGPDLIWFFLYMAGGGIQYFLIGLLIDKWLARRKKLKQKDTS